MDKETKELFYTTADGEWVDLYEVEMLDDDEIPWARVPKLKKFLNKECLEKDIHICLNSAQILCSWGIKEGLDFLELLVDIRIDKKENISPHRLKNYDQVYENISGSVINYYLRRSDEGGDGERESRSEVKSIIKKIISLSNFMMFDIQSILTTIKTYKLIEYIPDLENHLIVILNDYDNQYWKIVDCIQVLYELDQNFVKRILNSKGLSVSQYESDFRKI